MARSDMKGCRLFLAAVLLAASSNVGDSAAGEAPVAAHAPAKVAKPVAPRNLLGRRISQPVAPQHVQPNAIGVLVEQQRHEGAIRGTASAIHSPAPVIGGTSGAGPAMLVATLGSQSNFQGMAAAPLFVLCGLLTLAIHIGLLALAARVFRFDLYLCGISSLAGIGGVASAPVLAATYTPILVPIAVLLAMLGLILGTGIGLFMAQILSALAP